MKSLSQIRAKMKEQDKPLRWMFEKVSNRISSAARAALVLRVCDRVGKGARCVGWPIVRNAGHIEIGDRLSLTSRWNQIEMVAGPEGRIEIGDDVAINYGTLISAQKGVRIGHRTMIGNLCILSDTEAPVGGESGGEPRPIEIGDDVWLAVRVTVLPGAKIGNGAIVTAGSVVAGEIPPRVVAGGVPARLLRSVDGPDGGHASAPSEPAIPARGPAHAVLPAQPVPVEQRGVLISDFTIDDLAPALRKDAERPGVEAEVAPFGQVTQSLLSGPPSGASDFAVIWTRLESTIPSFGRLLELQAVTLEEILAEVDGFCDLVARGCAGYRATFVPTWTLPHWYRGLGLMEGGDRGVLRALTAMNLRLMERLSATKNVRVLNAQRWVEQAGADAQSPRLWYLGKMAFRSEVMTEAAREIKAALRALGGGARKLVVVDLDDTMWGGIVGDVGWENLHLGGHDAEGESFVDFQRELKALSRRGVVLAIVSKNEESVALEAIRKHPEMLLREDDFVAWRINWRDKAQNIAEIVAELNLGLQSVVFLDDNPVERARVREALPEVLVPEWPADKLLYRSALLGLRCFDTPALTQEDAKRTQLYAAERKREQLQVQVGSIDEWLKSLDIKVKAEPLGPANLTRGAQLFNKTNQMNLSTRRLTEQELSAWASEAGRALWAVTVSDRFGDAGLTGLVSVEAKDGQGRIVDFVLSCRVMGRKVENAMVHLAVEKAREQGAKRVEAVWLPTAKNKPCFDFWKGSGFQASEDGKFVWDAGEAYPLPGAITLERKA